MRPRRIGPTEPGRSGKDRPVKHVTVAITQDPDARDLPLPAYETDQAAGMDLRAAVTEPVTLAPGERAMVPTGICIALPSGTEAQVRPRSGLAIRHGISMVNSPGTIDADYRGEVQVLLINHGQEPFTINRGDRIAQMVIAPILQATWDIVTDLNATQRGVGGFGHTGV